MNLANAHTNENRRRELHQLNEQIRSTYDQLIEARSSADISTIGQQFLALIIRRNALRTPLDVARLERIRGIG